MKRPGQRTSDPARGQTRFPSATAPSRDERLRILLAASRLPDLEDLLADDYRVARLTDAVEILARARDTDLVVVDLALPGLDHYRLIEAIRSDAALAGVRIVLLVDQESDALSGLERGADDFLFPPFSAAELGARLSGLLLRADARGVAWAAHPVLSSLHDAVVVTTAEGDTVFVNEAFTRLTGWRAEDGPLGRRYPWWHEGEAPTERGECQVRTKGGDTLWVWVTTTTVAHTATNPVLLTVMRDVTREHASRARRAAAAELAGRFATAPDLTAVLIAAVDGFTKLFDGDSVVEVSTGNDSSLFTASGPVADVASLPEALRNIPSEGHTGADNLDGILLEARGVDGCRAWVRFGVPRIVPEDELIVGSLLAEAIALAVHRVTAANEFATRESHLQQAIMSHRSIGQAIGILVERHRLTPRDAFARLSKRSQATNIRVRELAARLVETGEEG